MITYSHGKSQYHRAAHAWQILAAWSDFRMGEDGLVVGTISYGELAERMGYERRAGRTLAPALGLIGYCCLANELPALNAIVVNKDTAMPGPGVILTPGRTVEQEMKAVAKKRWLSIRTPSMKNFRDARSEFLTEAAE